MHTENKKEYQSVHEGKQLEKLVSDLGSVFKIENLKVASIGKFSDPAKRSPVICDFP